MQGGGTAMRWLAPVASQWQDPRFACSPLVIVGFLWVLPKTQHRLIGDSKPTPKCAFVSVCPDCVWCPLTVGSCLAPEAINVLMNIIEWINSSHVRVAIQSAAGHSENSWCYYFDTNQSLLLGGGSRNCPKQLQQERKETRPKICQSKKKIWCFRLGVRSRRYIAVLVLCNTTRTVCRSRCSDDRSWHSVTTGLNLCSLVPTSPKCSRCAHFSIL